MNFFKDINSAVNKVNNFGYAVHPKNWLPGSSDYITQLIKTCSYTDDVKWLIEKSVRQVIQIYGSYKVDKIEFMQGGSLKRFIELIGETNVLNTKLQTVIMYPISYPNKPPFIRIINPNVNTYICTNFYKSFQSANDPKSFVLNPILQSSKLWDKNAQVVNIILQTNHLLQNNFPFQLINQQPNNQWGNINNNQYPNNNNYNPVAKQPPIPFKQSNEPAQYKQVDYSKCLLKAQNLVSSQKKKLLEIQAKHAPTLATIQTLQSSKYSLESQSLYINRENYKMKTFADETDISNIDFSQIIIPSDEVSGQILNLITSIRAKQDTVNFLQAKFNDERITLEDFLKNARKLQETKFEQKALLNKCLQSSGKFH